MLERDLEVIGASRIRWNLEAPLSDIAESVQHTDASVVAIIRRLRSQTGVLTKKKFEFGRRWNSGWRSPGNYGFGFL